MVASTSIRYMPSQFGTDLQWIEFHKQLKKEVGKANANSLFVKAFEKRKGAESWDGTLANTSTLREYLKGQGIEIAADGPFSYVTDTIDSVEGFIETAFNTSKWVVLIIALLIIVPAVIFMFNVARNPQMIAGAAKLAV